jgi:hypothetical protein
MRALRILLAAVVALVLGAAPAVAHPEGRRPEGGQQGDPAGGVRQIPWQGLLQGQVAGAG